MSMSHILRNLAAFVVLIPVYNTGIERGNVEKKKTSHPGAWECFEFDITIIIRGKWIFLKVWIQNSMGSCQAGADFGSAAIIVLEPNCVS